MTTKLFKEVQIGEKFHTGKSQGAGIHSNIQMWFEYEKVSTSQAKVIATPGYFNTRHIGHVEKIAAFKNVWPL